MRLEPIIIPPGMSLLRSTFYTTVAFTGGSATLSIGTSAGDSTYVNATSVASIGIYPLTLQTGTASEINLVNMPALSSSANLFVRLTQTAVATATGTGTLVLEYS